MINSQAAALDPNFSDPPVYGPQRPQEQERPMSVLDMLRKRVMREMEGQDLQRLSEYGAGMLASGSPNFFTMLGAGARAAQQGDASRMDRLRQVAETERQQRALENQEAAQRAQEAYQQRRLDVEAPLREAQTEQARAYAEFLRQGGRGGVRGQLTERDLANLSMRAAQRAAAEVPDPRPGSLEAVADTPAAAEARRVRREQLAQSYFAAALEAAGRGPAPGSTAAAGAPDVRAAPAPAAIIDVRGNPAR